MRWKQLIELTKVNLLYANPQILEKKRSQTAAGKGVGLSAPMTVIAQSALILVLFTFLYGATLLGFDFSIYPGYFTFFLLTFALMTVFQGFWIIYNLFYESKDLQHYMPLPFKNSEVFLAKFVVIVITVIPFMAPTFTIFFRLGQNAGHSILQILATSLLLFTLLTLAVFLIAVICVHGISRLALFQKYKKTITTALYGLSSLGMIAVIIVVSNTENPGQAAVFGQVIPDYPTVPFLHYFHGMILNPFSQEALIGLAAWLLALAALVLIVYKFVLPGIYEGSESYHAAPVANSRRKRTTKKGPSSIEGTLFKYNLSLIQDGTLMMQYISANVVFPLMMVGPVVLGSLSLRDLALERWWGLVFFIGFIYSFLTLNSISVAGVIISLERENFLYIKSLPFSLKFYLQRKFWFAFGVQLILPLIISLVMMWLVELPILLMVSFLAGLLLGIFYLCERYFIRDYRYLNLQWQNLTELFTRGGGNFIQAIQMFGVLIGGALVVVGVSFLMSVLPLLGRVLLSAVLVAGPIGYTLSRRKKHQEVFWQQFE